MTGASAPHPVLSPRQIREAERASDKVKAQLRKELLPPDIETLASEIDKFLTSKKLPRALMARGLANNLHSKLLKRPSAAVNSLIEAAPIEIESIRMSHLIDGIRAAKKCGFVTEANHGVPPAARERVRQSRHNHDLLRDRDPSSSIGLIEKQFTEYTTLSGGLTAKPPSGTCLDKLMRGSYVRMCIEFDSLQELFGVHRKRLPHSLPKRRKGRMFVYDYKAFLKCATYLLDADLWLEDETRRKYVLAGVIRRATLHAKPEIAKAFRKTLGPYLLR